MGLPTFEKFCCCCSLETGGIIVGVVNAIFGFFGILSGIAMIFAGSALMMYQHSNVDLFWWGIGFIITGSIFILFYLIYFIAGILLITAVNKREHHRMKLILILMAISVIISFISVVTSVWGGLIGAILYSLFTCYFFICIYSLYVKLKDGTQGGVVHSTPYA
ncbi:uncharacterized protein [Chironomus tepperi]|uniref:uncharacterized protein n=1 Tax=Chironomus tepperi TaxID=113505 RepID=UPI00391EEE51